MYKIYVKARDGHLQPTWVDEETLKGIEATYTPEYSRRLAPQERVESVTCGKCRAEHPKSNMHDCDWGTSMFCQRCNTECGVDRDHEEPFTCNQCQEQGDKP